MLGAFLTGIVVVMLFGFSASHDEFADGSNTAVAGAMLATMNTASGYGFGALIAAVLGFLVVAQRLQSISNPLINEAVTINLLSGITGSSSAG